MTEWNIENNWSKCDMNSDSCDRNGQFIVYFRVQMTGRIIRITCVAIFSTARYIQDTG